MLKQRKLHCFVYFDQTSAIIIIILNQTAEYTQKLLQERVPQTKKGGGEYMLANSKTISN